MHIFSGVGLLFGKHHAWLKKQRVSGNMFLYYTVLFFGMWKYTALRIFRGPELHISRNTWHHFWGIKGTRSGGTRRLVMTSFWKKEKSIDHSWRSSPRLRLVYQFTYYHQGLFSHLGTVEDLPRTAGIPIVGSKYCPSRIIYLFFLSVMANLRVPTLHVALIPHQKWYHVFWEMWSSGHRNILSAVYFHIWKKTCIRKCRRTIFFWKTAFCDVLICLGEKGSHNRTDVTTFCVNHRQYPAINLFSCLSVCLSIYLPTYLSIYLSIYLPT